MYVQFQGEATKLLGRAGRGEKLSKTNWAPGVVRGLWEPCLVISF